MVFDVERVLLVHLTEMLVQLSCLKLKIGQGIHTQKRARSCACSSDRLQKIDRHHVGLVRSGVES